MDNNETENILIEENQNGNIEEQINNFVESEDITDKIIEPEDVTDKIIEPENNTNENNIKDNTILGGVVNGCNRLNVRKEPSMNAEIVDVIDKNTIVNVDMKLSNEEFYKISVYNDIKIVD